ncbi:MAG: ABC transporter substrate-binding protein [Treponema sp.]|nr:ABC transporter substrate-binding protein [Treponema sp.]
MKKLTFVMAAIFMCGCLFTACSKKDAASSDIIKIGVFEPMTGANAAGGALEVEGIRLANELFPTVTVDGKEYKVELVIVDNKSDKVEAANAAQRLVDREKVKVILGSWGSGFSIAAGPIVQDAKVPALGLSCTNPLVTQGNPYYFRVCFIDPFQGTVMATYAHQNLGATNAVIIREVSNDYSVGLAKFFTDTFKELTGNPNSILAELNYNTGDQDFTAQLTTIRANNPAVIFAPGNYTESALIMKQARELGITAPFLGGDTWETPELIDVGKEAVEGCVLSTFFDAGGATSALAKTFLSEYDKQYHKEPAAVTALGFDGYRLALDAIMRANSLDTTKIRDALAATKDFEGVAGNVTLDENGDATKSAFIKTVKDGKFSYLTIVNP